MSKYVLITAAKNEEGFIEKTILSVLAQTVKPEKWIIVNDGSTDKTDEIVNKYTKKNNFIKIITINNNEKRNFGSKARAFTFGYKQLMNAEFDFIGNLDADISFEPSYYREVINKFKQDKKLGLAGGVRYDLLNGKFEKVLCAANSVGGPIQLFRKECFEAIGGYIPLKFGGIDAVAETMARMHGWKVQSYQELKIYHHRRTGSANRKILHAKFIAGIRDYHIGYHPLFQLSRSIYRSLQQPYFIGSFIWLCGYGWASLRRYKRQVSDDFLQYIRSEQLKRLRIL